MWGVGVVAYQCQKVKRGRGKGERANGYCTFFIIRAIGCGISGTSIRVTTAVLFQQTPTTVATDSVNGVDENNKSRDECDKVKDRSHGYTSGTEGAA